jgi:hypothetical protein
MEIPNLNIAIGRRRDQEAGFRRKGRVADPRRIPQDNLPATGSRVPSPDEPRGIHPDQRPSIGRLRDRPDGALIRAKKVSGPGRLAVLIGRWQGDEALSEPSCGTGFQPVAEESRTGLSCPASAGSA